jgi:PPOX class probable F420-dependent enzyme
MSPAEQAEFLSADGVLVRIATVNEDGSPHVTPAWFLCEGDTILFTPRAGSAWFANLQRDPRVGLCIDEDALPYRKVVVEGRAEVRFGPGQDDSWRDTYRRIAGKYMGHDPDAVEGYVQRTIDQPRALLAVDLRRSDARSWRMPVADEPDTGIWHARFYASGSALARDVAAPAG